MGYLLGFIRSAHAARISCLAVFLLGGCIAEDNRTGAGGLVYYSQDYSSWLSEMCVGSAVVFSKKGERAFLALAKNAGSIEFYLLPVSMERLASKRDREVFDEYLKDIRITDSTGSEIVNEDRSGPNWWTSLEVKHSSLSSSIHAERLYLKCSIRVAHAGLRKVAVSFQFEGAPVDAAIWLD